ncbi:MAG TPA: hypothetical protein VFQ92_13965 [Blastocatellia bacterium]|nr:hypothetical protein [Blastocatellia bacterium]
MADTQGFTNQYDLMRERIRELDQRIHHRIELMCELSREISMDLIEKEYLETETRKHLVAEFSDIFRAETDEVPFMGIPRLGLG